MAGSVNKVIIMGHLGRDPEIRSTSNGTKMATLNIATSENWKDRNSGERREKTEWHRVVVWPERLVEIVEKYVRKGDKIYIEGQLQTRKWVGNDGKENYTTEIVVQGFKGEINLLGDSRGGAGSRSNGNGGGNLRDRDADDAYEPAPQQRQRGRNDDLDDEIPF